MGLLTTSTNHAAHCAEVLKAVAHPLRLRIVAILCDGDQHVNGLVELLDAPQPTVSQQLRILRMANLVSVTRQNGFSLYSLAELRLQDLVQCVERCGTTRPGWQEETETGDVAEATGRHS